MIRHFKIALICIALLVLNQQSDANELSGSVAWTSDYVLRGVSQTDNLPAVQAEVDWRPANHWKVGAWASTLHVIPYTRSTELDIYLNRSWIIDQDWNTEITATHYGYLNDPRHVSYDYDELAVAAYWADTLYGRLAWSPNTDLYWYPTYAYSNQQTLTVEAGYHRPLAAHLHFQVGAGIYDPIAQSVGRYAYASTGISRRFGHFRAEFNYFWVQGREHRIFNAGPAGGPWTFTASWNF